MSEQSQPHPTPITFEEIQILQSKWPRVIGMLGDRINQVCTGYMEGDRVTWRTHDLDQIEGSMKLCEGCPGLPDCKQPDILSGAAHGSSTTGHLFVPLVSTGTILKAVRPCKYELLRAQAKSRPWVEKRHAEMTFKGFIVTDANRAAFNACQKYVRNVEDKILEGRGLVLSGPTGVGKTHLASAIFQNAMQRLQVRGSFVVVPPFLDELRSKYGDNLGSESAAAFMAGVVDTKLLVLDNLEIRNVTPWVIDTLFNIIDHRYRNLLSTIVTTGWAMEQMAEVLEEKTPSRLVQLCEWYHVNEVDWRREEAKGKNRKGPRKARDKS